MSFSAKISDSHLKTEFDEDLFFSGRLDDTDSVTLVDSFGARANADFVLMGFDHRISVSRHQTKTDSRASFPSLSEGRRDKAQWTARRDWNRHALTVLAETESETYAITPNFAFAPDEPKNTAQAIAADYRYSWDKLNLSGSIRRDFNDRFDDAVTWKIGASYSIPTIGGQLRASAGPGVKNPSMIELFGFYPEANFVGNASLTPEKSFGYGLGYTQELLGGDMKLSADYFRSEFTDEIFTDFSSFPFLARNRSFDSKREGLEFSLDWTVSDTVDIYGSVSVLETTENGIEEFRRPEFTASLTTSWQPVARLRLTGSLDHTGSQLDTNFSTFQTVKLDSFTLASLNAAYDLGEIVTLTLRGENLLDEDYQEVVGYASQGRGIFAGLRARFN